MTGTAGGATEVGLTESHWCLDGSAAIQLRCKNLIYLGLIRFVFSLLVLCMCFVAVFAFVVICLFILFFIITILTNLFTSVIILALGFFFPWQKTI